MNRSLLGSLFFGVCLFLATLWVAQPAAAATCAISTDTVIDQSYVTSNVCTAINITGNVSTTWVGTVDLGGGVVTVKTGNTMTMGVSSLMVLGNSDDFVVETNATATHVVADPVGLQITARNITISGSLDVSAKGCDGGATTGAVGQGPNTTTGVCGESVSGYGLANGGSAAHGGAGGNGWQASTAQSTTYGSSTAPSLLGSGGGSAFALYGGGPGGNGGGRIALTATGDLTVDGTIFAKGGAAVVNADASSGAGSGGSIYVRVAGTLDGSGSLSVAGGSAVSNGGNGGGSGGGGRLALYYGTLGTFSLGNAVAPRGVPGSGSTNGRPGDAGSTFILNRYTDDGAGDLRITSGLQFVTGVDYSRDLITVDSGSLLTCGAQTTLTISSASAFTADGTTWSCAGAITTVNISAGTTLATAGSMWSFGASGAVNITATTWSTGAASSTLLVSEEGSRSTWTVTNDLNLRQFKYVGASTAGFSSSAGGRLDIVGAIDLALASSTLLTSVSSTQLTSLAIDSDSFIRADGRGCAGGLASTEAAGPNTTTGVCGLSTSGYGRANGGGAGHAGIGGDSWTGTVQSATYGSSTYPILFGSGGGTAFTGYSTHPGGNGGGTINLVVSGPLTLNGQISADGAMPTTASGDAAPGGGSGGSVYIRASAVTGSATITANGGSGQSAGSSHAGGGGGGGRIALLYSDLSGYSLGFITANGGTKGVGGGPATDGAIGSIYSLQTNQAPSVPAELRPTSLVNGSTTGTGTPTLTFTLSDLDVLDTSKFQIQIDDSADFGSPVVDYTSALGAQGARSFQVGQAQGGGIYSVGSSSQTLASGSYYWRVKAMDAVLAESSYVTANAGAVAFQVDTVTRLISFQQTSDSGLESVTATSVRIVLNAVHFENVTANYAIVSGSSTADGSGIDFTLASGTATILVGQTSVTIPFTVVDDSIDEPDEVFTVTISDPVNASLGATTDFIYTITDNDTAGITFAGTSTLTATEGGAGGSFTVVLDSAPTSTISIGFATSTYGATLSTSTIAFTSLNWNTPVTVNVTATDDTVSEGTHLGTITPTISTTAYGYSGLSPAVISATITDNDSAGVSLSKSSASITEGRATDSYTVVLTTAPTSTVEVLLTASNARLSLSSSVLTFTTSDWSTPQTVTVSTVDDTLFQSDQTGTITHIASSTGIGYLSALSISLVTVSIRDTDNPGGGASSAGGSGGSVQTVFSLVPVPPPVAIKPAETTAPVVIIVAPTQNETTPPSAPTILPGQQVVTILNPTDIKSLVQATNGSRDFASEARSAKLLTQDAREFRVPLSDEQNLVLANFVTYGISERTRNLGSGERRALVRDALQTMKTGTVSPSDLERLASGMKPEYRNLSAEIAQLPRVRQTFQAIYGGLPNFKDPSEDLAWNALMYRIRFPRDLKEEAQGIQDFRKLFKKSPSDPFQWSVVRVLGYVK